MGNVQLKQGLNSKTSLVSLPQEVFVRKKLAKGDNPKRIKAMIKILRFCKKAGVKVPEVLSLGKTEYTLKFYKGKLFNGSQIQMKSIAKELAMLHKVLAKCRIPYSFAPHAKLYEYPKKAPSKFLTKLFLQYPKMREEKQLIHFDVQPGNVLFVGNRVLAILDFDAMRMGKVEEDIAFAAFRFAEKMEKTDRKNMRQNMDLFIKTYLRYNKVPGVTLGTLKPYLFSRLLSMVSAQLNSKKRNTKELQKFIRLLKLAEKVM